MAYYEIIAVLILLAFVFCAGRASKRDTSMHDFKCGVETGRDINAERVRDLFVALDKSAQECDMLRTDLSLEYKRGWEESKQVYYTDLRADRLAEVEREKGEREAEYIRINKENKEAFCPLSSDILMAYGVTSIGQLPKNIRDAYNITDDQCSIDLDTLIQHEQEV